MAASFNSTGSAARHGTVRPPARPLPGKRGATPAAAARHGTARPVSQPLPGKNQATPAIGSSRLASMLANPGLRSKLPANLLTSAQRQQRALNARLNAPVVAGGTLTGRQVAQQANAATDVYGGAAKQALAQELSQAQGSLADIPHYYDIYRQQLLQNAQNVQATNQQVNDQLARLQAGARNLDTSQTGPVNSQADAIRAQMLANTASGVAGQGAAQGTLASTLANVVEGQQRLQALAGAGKVLRGVQGRQTELGQRLGAYNEAQRGQLTANEAKNVLAQQLAGVKVAGTTAGLNERIRHNKAIETRSPTDSVYTTGAFAGHAKSEIAAMPLDQRQKLVKAYRTKTGAAKTAKPTRGPGSLTPVAEGRVIAQIRQVAALIKSKPTGAIKQPDGSTKTVAMTRNDLIQGSNPLGKAFDPAVVNAAYDLATYGALSPANVAAAHGLGIHVNGVFKIMSTPAPQHP